MNSAIATEILSGVATIAVASASDCSDGIGPEVLMRKTASPENRHLWDPIALAANFTPLSVSYRISNSVCNVDSTTGLSDTQMSLLSCRSRLLFVVVNDVSTIIGTSVVALLGNAEGVLDGTRDGAALSVSLGDTEGERDVVGFDEGSKLGLSLPPDVVRSEDDADDGTLEGLFVRMMLGETDGGRYKVGFSVGSLV